MDGATLLRAAECPRLAKYKFSNAQFSNSRQHQITSCAVQFTQSRFGENEGRIIDRTHQLEKILNVIKLGYRSQSWKYPPN